MWRWLAACGPGAPVAWEGIDQAVVLDAGQVVVDRYSSRTNADRTVLRTVDRCRWEAQGDALRETTCVVGPAHRSTLSRLGGLLVDEQIDATNTRTLHVLDPATLRPIHTLALGLEPEGRVPGGSWFTEGEALLLFANHGMSGVDVSGGDGRASFTVERWEDGALVWRHGLSRYPQEAHHVPGALAVLDQGEWRVYDTATGASRTAPTTGRAGACLDPHALVYLSTDEPPARVSVPTDGAPPSLTAAGPLPGWVGACVLREGVPWFHGGDADGNGWLLGPDGRVVSLPRVDLELGRHVDADGALWVVELGRGYTVWDPQTGQVTAAPRELHDVVRAGAWLLAYGVDIDLTVWMRSRSAEWQRPHRLSPRRWHVAGDELWTFAHRQDPGEPLVEVLTLPGLAPVRRWDATTR